MLSLLLFVLANVGMGGMCPFLSKGKEAHSGMPSGHPFKVFERVAPQGYIEAFEAIDFNAVKADLTTLLTTSQSFFPADYGNYGPLMVRLAWHAAGSYRIRDGRGGADGGRMRFDPERSWDDNTNLDKARRLLEPIKTKYGLGLSWGDLIVLAGDTAIEQMGGPILGFCGGRIDDSSGFWSEKLGPTQLQEETEPCPTPGNCTLQGANVVGLIYVNPEGPFGNPDPALSAEQVRSTFARMGMNDEETVALVGGGHAFGKTHGPCPNGPGPRPSEQPENPWPGMCGTGIGLDTFTSGFEGPWTSNPIKWSNEYFKNLIDYEWEKVSSPAGHTQWAIKGAVGPLAPLAHGGGQRPVMMLTADLAFKYDPENKYQSIIQRFADEPTYLDRVFSNAWYKLMTRDMGPVTRCLGNPPFPKPFQGPLNPAPAQLPDFDAVKAKIKTTLTSSNMALYTRLAWRCAATFRVTDYLGGCNGARIRLSPQIDWPVNAGLNTALSLLEPIQQEFQTSWADLIVLAGNTALEAAGAPDLPFCGGRVDASEDNNSEVLEPVLKGEIDETLHDLREAALLLNLSPREFTALMGKHSIGAMDPSTGFSGQRDTTPGVLDNEYYKNLISADWQQATSSGGKQQYKALGKELYINRADFMLVLEPEFLMAAQDFASDQQMWLDEFARVWTKVMTADRYDGPTGNLCPSYDEAMSSEPTEMPVGPSGGPDVIMTSVGKYPGYSGAAIEGTVELAVVTDQASRRRMSSKLRVLYDLSGVTPSGSGMIAIKKGMSCSDSSMLADNFYDDTSLSSDPWSDAMWSSNAEGKASGNFEITTGFDTTLENLGRSVVVYDNGMPVSCGVLLAPVPADESCAPTAPPVQDPESEESESSESSESEESESEDSVSESDEDSDSESDDGSDSESDDGSDSSVNASESESDDSESGSGSDESGDSSSASDSSEDSDEDAATLALMAELCDKDKDDDKTIYWVVIAILACFLIISLVCNAWALGSRMQSREYPVYRYPQQEVAVPIAGHAKVVRAADGAPVTSGPAPGSPSVKFSS